MEKKRLFLIDGHALLYRSYYAIRGLINSKGFPTNAIFGFVSAIKKLTDQEKPDFLAVVLDSKGPTFRHELYSEYKANRKPMPEDLVVQIPVLKELIQAMDIPTFEYAGYEADDIIGTLTKKAASLDLQSVIVSSDKDLLQLIDDSTSMYNPKSEAFIGKQDVKEIFGVNPDQVIDVLSLWGDSSDNIPGVPGVGEKTAKNLINEFGSLDRILASPEKINNPKVREKLLGNRGLLDLSRKLATIETDLPLEVDLESLSLSSPPVERILPILKELEFTSLLSSYLQKEENEKATYNTILQESELQELVKRIEKAGFVALDTETDNIFPMRAQLVGMSFSIESNAAYYLPLRHDYEGAPPQIVKERAFAILSGVLTSPKIKKIGQNIKYDSIVLHNEGLALQGIDEDSMVLSYLLEPNWGRHNLNRLAQHYLHVQAIPFNEIVGKGKNEVTMNSVEIDKVFPYACQDADLALRLCRHLAPIIKEKGLEQLYRNIEQPLIPVLTEMEIWGITVDAGILKDLSEELAEELDRLKKRIFDISGEEFNLNSPQQLSRILFEKLKLPPSRKTRVTRGYSTGFEVLQDLAQQFPVAQHTLEHRQLSKLKSGYADSLPLLINKNTGRIHTSYNQTVAATGRLSS
ncbi:DNA polymerase, partial [Acidobacteriota bacterium]